MSDEIAIKVEHVSKDFVLPHEKIGSVKSAFTSLYRKKNKTRGTQHALKDISFEIKKGEFFGIVGRNGSGKSTMLKILAGIYQPTSGKVHTRGKLVPFIELGVGFNPELTGRENVFLNGALLGFSRREIEVMYDDIVRFAELERFMDQKLKNYSSGMQVRLAFSMATRANADILLIDEVLAVGDADFQRKCFEYFKSLKKNKKTVVFVSHDMDAVREYCDNAVLIEENSLRLAGSAQEVSKEYTKLFTQDAMKSGQKQGVSGNRWGNEKVITEKVLVNLNQSKGQIKISTTLHTKDNVDGPIVGFSIKNAKGIPIMGTNTKLLHVELTQLHAHDTQQLVWTMPNILADGAYTIDTAVLEKDGITVCDWWEDAQSFSILKATPSVYDISPEIEVAVNV